MSDDIDYDLYYEVIQLLLDVMWRNEDDLTIGEDISDIPAVKIIFDGYGDLESEDENGEYIYEEGGNRNMESYAIFIHRGSGDPDFVFPEHTQTPWALVHRPQEEVCIYAWYDVENSDWMINSLDETSDHAMTDEEVIEVLRKIKEHWFKYAD